MEPAYHGIEEETVTRLPSKAFDEFLKALDRPVPQTARDLIGMEPRLAMRFASPRRAWSGDVLDGSGCGRRAHLRAAATSCAGRRETRTSAV